MARYRALAREQAEAAAWSALYRALRAARARPGAARELLGRSRDGRAGARGDRRREADVERLQAELQAALLPRDPDDARNAFLEIRAGTGGDESALFAGDLARMYLRYCRAPAAGAPR